LEKATLTSLTSVRPALSMLSMLCCGAVGLRVW
jgi:hypothetical protein